MTTKAVVIVWLGLLSLDSLLPFVWPQEAHEETRR